MVYWILVKSDLNKHDNYGPRKPVSFKWLQLLQTGTKISICSFDSTSHTDLFPLKSEHHLV